MIDTIPSVFCKAIFIVCEHKIYFSHVLIQNHLLWIFELYLYYWSQSKEGLNGSWPDMMGLSNLPSLVQEINIWLWCEISFHVFPPRPDPGYPFHPLLSQRGNQSKVHVHQNIFFTYFFLPPVFQMELTGILLEDRKASCSPKLDSQSTTLQKTFCNTKCNRWLRRGERIKATILKTKGSHNKLVHIKQQFLESQNPSQGRQDAHTCTYTYTKSPGDHVQNDIIGWQAHFNHFFIL